MHKPIGDLSKDELLKEYFSVIRSRDILTTPIYERLLIQDMVAMGIIPDASPESIKKLHLTYPEEII